MRGSSIMITSPHFHLLASPMLSTFQPKSKQTPIHGCQACMKIPAQQPPKSSRNVAQLAVSSEFAVMSTYIHSRFIMQFAKPNKLHDNTNT